MKNKYLTEQDIKSRIKIQNDLAVINTIHLAEILNVDELHLNIQIQQLLQNNALLIMFFTEEEQTEEPSYYLSLRSFTLLNFDLSIKRDIVTTFIMVQDYMLQIEDEYRIKKDRKEKKQ